MPQLPHGAPCLLREVPAAEPARRTPRGRLDELSGGRGIDYVIDATGVSALIETVIAALTPRGVIASIGAPALGTTVALDINFMLNGRQYIGVTEGDSNPQVFLPALVDLIRQGRFPLHKLVRYFDFAEIN